MLLTVMKRGSSALGIFDREVALVLLQRRDQHLARQREKARLEVPGERHRPLDQRGDLIEQRRGDQSPGRRAGGQRGDLRRGSARAAPRNPQSPGRAAQPRS